MSAIHPRGVLYKSIHHCRSALYTITGSRASHLEVGVVGWNPMPSTMPGALSRARWRTNMLVISIFILGMYIFFSDSYSYKPATRRDAGGDNFERDLELAQIEAEYDNMQPAPYVTYKPLLPNLGHGLHKFSSGNASLPGMPLGHNTAWEASPLKQLAKTLEYHKLWTWAEQAITRDALFPDSPQQIQDVLDGLASARIVHVDSMDLREYESGTSEKWVVILEGGQKAMMKIIWESKGKMKEGALCNYGFEMPSAEIAGFHLHKVLGFRNTPYVTGRRIDLLREVLPVASPAVARQIVATMSNETCVLGKCYFCEKKHRQCPPDGIVEASISYWVPRRLKIHTYPPSYMPYSTPRMKEWGNVAFNNQSYCNSVRKNLKPYHQDEYFYDLMDFGAVDTLMYHYDSKHYTVDDNSPARGLTVRLDHGRAFCAYDRDDEKIFLAPIRQCCKLRKKTYDNLNKVTNGRLTRLLKESLSKDPIAPILSEEWYPALERRLKMILAMVDKCASYNNGMANVLV